MQYKRKMFNSDDISSALSLKNLGIYFIVILLCIIYYHGTILWCIIIGIIFILIYYLLRRFFGDDELVSAQSIEEIKNVKRLEESLNIIYTKWKELGKPSNIKNDVNFINFLYAIKPWSVYNVVAFNSLVESIDFYMIQTTSTTKTQARDACLNTLENFEKMDGYASVVERFKVIAANYM